MFARIKAEVKYGILGVAVGFFTISALQGQDTPAKQVDAEQRLSEEVGADRVLRQEIQAQAEGHLEAGKRFFSDFEYERAQAELMRAVNLDRSNEEARKLLIQVNDLMGKRKSRIQSAVAQLYGERKVAIQARLVELDNFIDYGKRHAKRAKGDPDLDMAERIRGYEQAIQHFERAREIVKWMPPDIDTEEQGNLVTRYIRECQQSIKALSVELTAMDKERAAEFAERHKELERRERIRKINVLVDQAQALFEVGNYDEAEVMAKKILELDPYNAEANTIETTARDRRHIKTRKWIQEEKLNESKKNLLYADSLMVPHNEYLKYPKNWHEMTARTAPERERRRSEPWKEDIQRKLARKVSFEFVDTPLEEAIAFLDSLTPVNMILDPKVAIDGAGQLTINLRVKDMEMQTALKWILRLAELDYDLRNEAVFITRPANLTANVELEIYDIRDLTTTIADFPGPRIDLGVAAPGGGLANPFAPAAADARIGAADLAQLIQEKLLPADFADPSTSIQESAGKLVVMQRPEVHDKISQILKNFRESQTIQVLTQVRFIDVQEGFLEQIGVYFTGLDSAINDPGVPFARVDPVRSPSKYGLFPIGGGPGLTPPLPSDVQSSPAFQFQNSVNPQTGIFEPPFHFDVGPPSSNPGPRSPLLLRPRIDSNFPVRGNGLFGAPNAAAGFRRQWYEKAFGSPVLIQGLTQNFVRNLSGAGVFGNALSTNLGNQGAIFQFRFLQSVQASAVLQALRKDQTADILLSPRLTQFNNQRSHIMVAQQRSYIADYDVSGAVFDPVIRSFLTGVVLDVKPTVSHDRRYVTLTIRAGTASEVTAPQIIFLTNGGDINNALGFINLPIELPELELRSINTVVTIPDGGTMLFSGLINDRKIDGKSGVPFFSDLPIIGRFFSTNIKHRERRNLLILVHPKIILFDEEEQRL